MVTIIHEDDALIVVAKPAGLATLASDQGMNSLANELIHLKPELKDLPDSGIAHRLDNDTSGIIFVGKTQAAYDHLRAQFKNNQVTKRYTALVLGSMPDDGAIDAPIAHHPRKKKKMIVCESEARAKELKARVAHTVYRVLKRYGYQGVHYTLVEVEITTGVRHQIRAHLAWKGFPLAGDKLYQNPQKSSEDVLDLKRHFLHAAHLEINHPATSARLSFDVPLSSDLERVLKRAQPIE